MQTFYQHAPATRGWHWRQAALSFLALSAAVDVALLEERSENGQHRYHRGRHKYYGIGSLVIFFAIFSAYGMGHMLATMSNVSVWGASIAGLIWGVFQWCLERQILVSIRSDAPLILKVFGFSWRALLALLSASTMVYPFFVESNRAEIDVKVGEMARARLVENLHSAQLAVGLPALNQDFSALVSSIKTVDVALATDPPELPAMKQKAKLCWNRFREEEQRINSRIKQIKSGISAERIDAVNEGRIEALGQKLQASRSLCQGADAQVVNKLVAWKEQKNAERKLLMNKQGQLQTGIDQAKLKENDLAQEQATKIALAAKSGFAADFVAVAELVRNDANRRFQLIWWLTWFLAIELVAILVKFTSNTDLDLRINTDETLVNTQTQQNLSIAQEQLATAGLKASMKSKGEQAIWLTDDGRQAMEQGERELMMQNKLHQQVTQLSAELRLPVELLKVTMAQFAELEQIVQGTKQARTNPRLDALIEQALERISKSFTNALVSAGRL
jgi:hypothetical protein